MSADSVVAVEDRVAVQFYQGDVVEFRVGPEQDAPLGRGILFGSSLGEGGYEGEVVRVSHGFRKVFPWHIVSAYSPMGIRRRNSASS